MSRWDDGPLWARRLPALLAEAVKIYQARGRELSGLDDGALAEAFASAFRAYAEDQGNSAADRRLNSVAGEYVLRHLDAPIAMAIERAARNLVWFPGPVDEDVLPESVSRMPMALLAFGRVMWIPRLGSLFFLHYEDDWSREGQDVSRARLAAEIADLDWVFGLRPE